MEIAKSGGIMLFIIDRIVSRTKGKKWMNKNWVEKRTLEDIFDILARRKIEVYVHFDFDEPWGTFDEDLAEFAAIGLVEVESVLAQKPRENDESAITLEESVRICLTEKGKKIIENSTLSIREHQKIIEEVIDGIALNKN